MLKLNSDGLAGDGMTTRRVQRTKHFKDQPLEQYRGECYVAGNRSAKRKIGTLPVGYEEELDGQISNRTY